MLSRGPTCLEPLASEPYTGLRLEATVYVNPEAFSASVGSVFGLECQIRGRRNTEGDEFWLWQYFHNDPTMQGLYWDPILKSHTICSEDPQRLRAPMSFACETIDTKVALKQTRHQYTEHPRTPQTRSPLLVTCSLPKQTLLFNTRLSMT